jgi:hypothetical protein
MAACLVIAAPTEAQTRSEGGWSADLLNQILKDDTPKPATLARVAVEPPAEMVLHTYPLAHLRVGEAGKTQNVIAILNKLLPPGSSLKPDVASNSLHLLTTPAAHQAAWDYLSAVDVADTTPATAPEIPPEVKAALQKLVEGTARADKLGEAIAGLHSDVAKQLADIDARQRRATFKLIVGSSIAGVIVLLLVVVVIRRQPSPRSSSPDPTAALVVAPDQLANALVPVHDKMRTDMLGLLNEVAIKLQAQHNEQQKLVREQQQQLEGARLALAEERKQFISEAGTMVVQAVERVDATTAKLAKQQDKVAELVEELQHTVRELDETKDSLRDREVELEQERAKIAALSLLLEEGGTLPPLTAPNGPNGSNGQGPGDHALETLNGNGAGTRATATIPCTNQETITVRTTLLASSMPPKPFTFLRPDHPET